MHTAIPRLVAGSAMVVALCAGLVAVAAALRATPPDYGLIVPAGFEVERVAGPPLVTRPIVADFDDEGRLYVADSSGSNDKVEQQLQDRTHRIVRLTDRNGDGVFDSSTVFADRMMFPEGTMWFDGSLYVAAPPSIWKLTDTDGDGVADQREEWFQGQTLTGCANDLHGPYLGPDGWIYWTKGAFAQQTYERPGKPPLVTRASHIFRRRPGSSVIESVMTGGMDNPVDVAFTSTGERILTATFLEHPQLGRRDAVLHAVYGGLYGKPHAVIDGHVRTGDLMPVMLQLGPAVPAGLTRYSSPAFGAEYRDNFFAAMFNLRKVTRLVLERSGATFTSRESDLVVSQSLDFHPTDVVEDADGSLLVVDTGPWYKLCCPTSQLAKPDLPGAIYRVRKSGASRVRDPRGLALPWSTMDAARLSALLDDPRPAVQRRATHLLGTHGAAAVGTLGAMLDATTSIERRRNAVWALTRIDGPQAREAVRAAFNDRDRSVRETALHAISLWRDEAALPKLLEAVAGADPGLQRGAAEALGRIGSARAVPALLAAAATAADRVREHALTYALIEIADPTATATGLRGSSSSRSKRAALIALDQMDGGALKVDVILPLLDSADGTLRDTAWWIAGRHPEWGGTLASYFGERILTVGAAGTEELQRRLALFGETPAIQAVLAAAVAEGSAAARAVALRTMATVARGRVKSLPEAWTAPIVRVLDSEDPELIRAAVAVLRAAPAAKAGVAEANAALLRVARTRTRPGELRLEALGAIQGPIDALDPELFELTTASLAPGQPIAARQAASRVIENARLTNAQLGELTAVLTSAGPLELPRILRAFDGGTDEAVGMRLLDALERSPARATVTAEALRARIASYPDAVRRRGDALVAATHTDAAAQARVIEELVPAIAAGDVRRGQLVFNGQKGACLTCHAIGYVGGKVGPDLTRIGQIRSERDLLEAIVYPSASFVRSFEPMTVTTRSGQLYSGVVRSDVVEEVVVATGAREDLRIPRTDIADIRPAAVSIMPPGYLDQLSRQELADLVAFLKASR